MTGTFTIADHITPSLPSNHHFVVTVFFFPSQHHGYFGCIVCLYVYVWYRVSMWERKTHIKIWISSINACEKPCWDLPVSVRSFFFKAASYYVEMKQELKPRRDPDTHTSLNVKLKVVKGGKMWEFNLKTNDSCSRQSLVSFFLQHTHTHTHQIWPLDWLAWLMAFMNEPTVIKMTGADFTPATRAMMPLKNLVQLNREVFPLQDSPGIPILHRLIMSSPTRKPPQTWARSAGVHTQFFWNVLTQADTVTHVTIVQSPWRSLCVNPFTQFIFWGFAGVQQWKSGV